MYSRAEVEITGRAESCKSAKQRSLYLSTNTWGEVGGNSASLSSQALLTQGHSNLCPLSSFKLNTMAAFSTCCWVQDEGVEKSRRTLHASQDMISISTFIHPLLAQFTALTTL
uniref:Uncharacterized protein LOC105118571 n=1 Tax=Rhizophora mucronata TaxID=61149 RepID=A0A2P2KTG5_RHIMU